MSSSLGHSVCIRYADITGPIVDSSLVNWQLRAFGLLEMPREKNQRSDVVEPGSKFGRKIVFSVAKSRITRMLT